MPFAFTPYQTEVTNGYDACESSARSNAHRVKVDLPHNLVSVFRYLSRLLLSAI